MTTEDAGSLAGTPDGFQRLWTPHRMVYIGGENKPPDATPGACPFCLAPSREDADGLVVHRGEAAYVVMNLYPYSPGHLLVCPYRHVSDYTEATAAERGELAELTATAMAVIRSVSGPAGFNLGINQGEVAGAGIAAHLHQHIVPRWRGDSNFLPIVAQT
ncbi:MAG: HIT domain-containing protein, partial [Propionicimonas sp.]